MIRLATALDLPDPGGPSTTKRPTLALAVLDPPPGVGDVVLARGVPTPAPRGDPLPELEAGISSSRQAEAARAAGGSGGSVS